jgi:hypothetical protein
MGKQSIIGRLATRRGENGASRFAMVSKMTPLGPSGVLAFLAFFYLRSSATVTDARCEMALVERRVPWANYEKEMRCSALR